MRSHINTAIKGLKADNMQVPCSPLQMDSMTTLAAKASYIRGLGYIKDYTLVCSTLTPPGSSVTLGTENRRNAAGVRAWNAIELPNIPGVKFNVSESDGYAAIVSPSLVITILPEASSIALAQVGSGGHDLLSSRGIFKTEWLQHYHGRSTLFSEGGYFVAVRPSGNGDVAIIAAMPDAELQTREIGQLWKWVPIGTVVGLFLAFTVFLFARHRLSLQSEAPAALSKKVSFPIYQRITSLRAGIYTEAQARRR